MPKLITILIAALMLSVSATVFAEPVDINTADAQSLASNIVGVGAKKATAIIEYRKKNGPFTKAEDLMKIKGIGPKIFAKNKDNILVATAKPKALSSNKLSANKK